MRAVVMLMFLSVAVPCYAEDPLEGLNTIEETLTLMEKSLEAQAWDGGDGEVASGPRGGDAAAAGTPLQQELDSGSEEPSGVDGAALVKSSGPGDMVLLPEPGFENCPP